MQSPVPMEYSRNMNDIREEVLEVAGQIASLFDITAVNARAEAQFAAMEASSELAGRRALAALEADAGDWIFSDA